MSVRQRLRKTLESRGAESFCWRCALGRQDNEYGLQHTQEQIQDSTRGMLRVGAANGNASPILKGVGYMTRVEDGNKWARGTTRKSAGNTGQRRPLSTNYKLGVPDGAVGKRGEDDATAIKGALMARASPRNIFQRSNKFISDGTKSHVVSKGRARSTDAWRSASNTSRPLHKTYRYYATATVSLIRSKCFDMF